MLLNSLEIYFKYFQINLKSEINETGKRASKGLERIGEDMARLRRGAAITLTDEMARLRQTVSGVERVRLGENMARL